MKKTLKSSLSLFFAIAIVLSFATVGLSQVDFGKQFVVRANAANVIDSGTCGDNITWTLDEDRTLIISGYGEMLSYTDYNKVPWYSSRLLIEKVVISYGVTEICSYSFYDCAKITSITIPNSVGEIGNYAFYGCIKLNPIIIPDGVTSIGDDAFSGCTSLATIEIPDSVTSIGDDAFSGCTSLEKIYWNAKNVSDFTSSSDVFYRAGTSGSGIEVIFGNTVERIPAYLFYKSNITSVTIPENVTSIGNGAFYECTSLEKIYWNAKNVSDFTSSSCVFCKVGASGSGIEVIFGNTVERIPAYLFYKSKIASVTISENVTSIGDDAFYECTSLKKIYWNAKNVSDFTSSSDVFYRAGTSGSGIEVIFGNTVERIPAYLFYKSKIASVTISENVTSIGGDAFYECTSLKKIYWNAKNVSDSYIFYGAGTSSSGMEVIFGNTVERIPAYLFYKSNITSATIPNSVREIGDYAFYECTSLTSITIPGSVTSIGNYAFYFCTNLSSVKFGNGVTSIGERAFNKCRSLTSITIPDTVTSIGMAAFSQCTSVTSISIGNSVTSIGSSAFYGCTSLTSINIPDSVTSIGHNGFEGCTNLTSVNITDIEAWCNIDFLGSNSNPLYNGGNLYLNGELVTDVVIPEGITSIGTYAFYNCTSLTTIKIPDSVTSIGACAFEGCTSLTSCNIPNGVTSIGNAAFKGCAALKSMFIPNSVTDVGVCLFYNCSSLTDVVLSENTLELRPQVIASTSSREYRGFFEGCSSLKTIIIPDSVTNIGYNTFKDCTSLEKIYWNAKNISDFTSSSDVFYRAGTSGSGIEVIFGNTVERIPAYLFYNSSKITSVIIPNSVREIGDYAFYECKSLTSITIPGSVTSIGAWAFSGCTNLSSVKFGNGVTSIGNYAFKGCTNLTDIVISDSITNIGDYAFSDCINLMYVYYHDLGIDLDNITIGTDNDYFLTARFVHLCTCDDGVIDIEATCTEAGSKHRTCIVCGESTTEEIPAKGHTASGWKIDKESTCTEKGSQHKECTVCKKVLETKEITLKEHKESNWIVDAQATVYSAGSKHKECTECGEVLETATIPQLKCAKPVLKKVYNANSYVKITWGAVEGADLYRVYRKTGTGEYEYIGSTKNTYYNDKEAGAGKTCRYRIRAKNEAGYSEYSASIAIKHLDEPTLKSIENSAYGVLIKWDKVTGAEKYNVYRKVSGGTYEYIGVTSNTYYTDKTAESGTKYYYAIRGKRDDSVSSQSASISKYYLEAPTLNAPTSTSKGIGLRWSEVNGAEGYKIYRKEADGSYKLISTEEGVSNVTFRDTTAEKGTKYYYKVKAYKSKTYSAYSNTKSITDKY